MGKKRKAKIPQSVGELTADWFTNVIGLKYGGSVQDVETEVIGEGVGFLGELHRCSLKWSDGSGGPNSVIVKFPSMIKKNRALGEVLGSYERESYVSKEMVEKLGVVTPEFIYGDLDPHPAPWLETFVLYLCEKLPIGGVSWVFNRVLFIGARSPRKYLLMIEDIPDARAPSQAVGGSMDDARAGLDILAKFHAHNWMDRTKIENPIIWSVGRSPKLVQASYRRNREAFVARFGEAIGPEVIAKMDEIQANFSDYNASLDKSPWTLIHGDYRLDNLLFRPEGKTVLLDWQALAWGRAGWEVTYFITTALEPHHKEEEEMMLRRYHKVLVESGVADYDYGDLLKDVATSKIMLAHRMVAADDLLDTAKDNGEIALVDLLVTRVVGWIDPS